MFGLGFMAIFVKPPPEFYLMKIVARKFNAKNCNFEMALKSLFVYEKGWGKFV